jgi:hypothetical protein
MCNSSGGDLIERGVLPTLALGYDDFEGVREPGASR